MEWQIEHIPTLDSTSSEAERRLAAAAAPQVSDGLVIWADAQDFGRGQGDHRWHSLPGANLTFTAVLLAPPVPAADQQKISDAAAMAVKDWLETRGLKPWIKPPNDIWIGDRKICGLLIKHRVRCGRILWTLIGVGANLNETDFPADLPNPTSLSMETGKTYDREAELDTLLDCLSRRLDDINK